MPEGSQNAAVMAAKLLCGCENLCENDKSILFSVAKLSEDYYGGAVGISAQDEHFGKNTCVLGISLCNDGKGFFKYDIRYGTLIASEDMIKNITSAFEKEGFEVEIAENCPCFVTGAERKYIDTVLNVYIEETGIKDAKEYYSGGGTYARYLGNSFGMNIHDYSGLEVPKCDLPAGHGEAHQPDEKIYIDAFFKGIVTDCMMMVELDSLLNE
jgi:succinyl-diaminopimelate desuccinylase